MGKDSFHDIRRRKTHNKQEGDSRTGSNTKNTDTERAREKQKKELIKDCLYGGVSRRKAKRLSCDKMGYSVEKEDRGGSEEFGSIFETVVDAIGVLRRGGGAMTTFCRVQ